MYVYIYIVIYIVIYIYSYIYSYIYIYIVIYIVIYIYTCVSIYIGHFNTRQCKHCSAQTLQCCNAAVLKNLRLSQLPNLCRVLHKPQNEHLNYASAARKKNMTNKAMLGSLAIHTNATGCLLDFECMYNVCMYIYMCVCWSGVVWLCFGVLVRCMRWFGTDIGFGIGVPWPFHCV